MPGAGAVIAGFGAADDALAGDEGSDFRAVSLVERAWPGAVSDFGASVGAGAAAEFVAKGAFVASLAGGGGTGASGRAGGSGGLTAGARSS